MEMKKSDKIDQLVVDFIGDISLNNGYEKFETDSNPFSNISEKFCKSDYVIGNLECICRGTDFNYKKIPRLHTSEKALEFLKEISLTHVTLAHNHIYDTLLDGYRNTINKLEDLSIDHSGASLTRDETYQPFYVNKNGMKIGFLNLVHEDTNPSLPADCEIFLNYLDEAKARKVIREMTIEADHVVMLLHWGGKHEGSYYPQQDQRIQARKLIDFGADLIIGHHSHTVQPFEVYKGKHIYYSLGNFCFDDVISDGKTRYLSPKRKRGLLLNVTFKKKEYIVVPHYIKTKNLEVFMDGQHIRLYVFLRHIIFTTLKRFTFFYRIINFFNRKVRPGLDFILYDKTDLMAKMGRIIKRLSK